MNQSAVLPRAHMGQPNLELVKQKLGLSEEL